MVKTEYYKTTKKSTGPSIVQILPENTKNKLKLSQSGKKCKIEVMKHRKSKRKEVCFKKGKRKDPGRADGNPPARPSHGYGKSAGPAAGRRRWRAAGGHRCRPHPGYRPDGYTAGGLPAEKAGACKEKSLDWEAGDPRRYERSPFGRFLSRLPGG